MQAQKKQQDRRIVSLWFPRLALDRQQRKDRCNWQGEPFAIIRQAGNVALVVMVNDSARHQGVRPGMKLADARAVCRDLRAWAENQPADLALLEKLARWCVRFTPLVALDPPEGLFLDITGCTHLFGGEQALQIDMMTRLARSRIRARTAIAPTPAAAWALARFGNLAQNSQAPNPPHPALSGPTSPRWGEEINPVADEISHSPLMGEGWGGGEPAVLLENSTALRAALSPLPVAALRLEEDVCANLISLGLDHIGALMHLSGASLARRFGMATLERLNQALGHASEPLDFLPFRPSFRVRRAFAEPVLHGEPIELALKQLLVRLCARLEKADQGTRRVVMTIERNDHTAQNLEVRTATAMRTPGYICDLFALHLDKLNPGFGIDFIEVHAPATESIKAGNPTILESGAKQGGASGGVGNGKGDAALARLLDVFENRLGGARVRIFSPASCHIPEHAFKTHAAISALSRQQQAKRKGQEKWENKAHDRPLKLLRVPQSLDDFTRAGFFWQGRRHLIARAHGPERIEPEWWHQNSDQQARVRDYWWLELTDGRRFWAYRRHEPSQFRWYLHGLDD